MRDSSLAGGPAVLKKVGRPEKVSQEETPFPSVGYRRRGTPSAFSALGEPICSGGLLITWGGDSQNAPPYPGQLRGVIGDVVPVSLATPRHKLQLCGQSSAFILHNHDHNHNYNNTCKGRCGKRRWQQNVQKKVEAESEKEKEPKIAPEGPMYVGNSAGTPRLDLDTLIFRHSRTSRGKLGLTSANTGKQRISKSKNHEDNRTCQQNSYMGNLKVDGRLENIQNLHSRRPCFDAGRDIMRRVGSVEEGSPRHRGEDMEDRGRGDADTGTSVTQPGSGKDGKDLRPGGEQCEDRDCIYHHPSGYGDRYWSTYAIKEWLREWFRQNPMRAWSIDNYDGEESYEELQLKTNEKYSEELRLKAELFHKMRSMLPI